MNKVYKLIYWTAHKNFGDELSKYLVEKMTGRTFQWESVNLFKYDKPTLVAIGSLLNRSTLSDNVVIWGTGTLTKHSLDITNKIFPLNRFFKGIVLGRPEIRGVRGPLTRLLIERTGINCPRIYGDPAILLPKIYLPRIGAKHKIGLVLHQSHCLRDEDAHTLDTEGIKLIYINREGESEIEGFVNEVVSCERIFSTSLHGLIVSQAYGIPAQWVQFNKKPIHADESHKFEDYFLGSGQFVQQPLIINAENVKNLIKMKSIPVIDVRPFDNIDRLYGSFPFEYYI